MTTIHIERDGKDQAAHTVSLDVLTCDAPMRTSARPQQPEEEGGGNREGGADGSPEVKEPPLPPAFRRPEVLEALLHIKTQENSHQENS